MLIARHGGERLLRLCEGELLRDNWSEEAATSQIHGVVDDRLEPFGMPQVSIDGVTVNVDVLAHQRHQVHSGIGPRHHSVVQDPGLHARRIEQRRHIRVTDRIEGDIEALLRRHRSDSGSDVFRFRSHHDGIGQSAQRVGLRRRSRHGDRPGAPCPRDLQRRDTHGG